MPHNRIDGLVRAVLSDVSQYIIYPHHGKGGNNPHVHICIAGSHDPKDVERYRKRCRAFGRGSGKLMAKSMHNGVCGFVSYVKHEASTPILQGFERDWFDQQEPFRKVGIGHYMDAPVKKRNPDTFFQLSYSNMLKCALRYRAQHGIESTNLEDTVSEMCKNGWDFQIAVKRAGIPDVIFEQFTKMCCGQDYFTPGRVAMMKTAVCWKSM